MKPYIAIITSTKDSTMKLSTLLLSIILCLLCACSDKRADAPKAVPYTLVDTSSALWHCVSDGLGVSELGIVKDTLKATLITKIGRRRRSKNRKSLLERMRVNERYQNRIYDFYIVEYKGDTVRVVTPRSDNPTNDSTTYVLNEIQDTIRFIPADFPEVRWEYDTYYDTSAYYKESLLTVYGALYCNTLPIPETPEEACKHLDIILSDSSKANIRKSGVGGSHFGMGMWLRNNWGLWGGSKLKDYFLEKGIEHADNMSSSILNTYYHYVATIEKAPKLYPLVQGDISWNSISPDRYILDDSVRYYKSLIRNDSSNGELYAKLANCEFIIGRYKESAKSYTKSISLGGDKKILNFARGQMLCRVGEFEKAIVDFKQFYSLVKRPIIGTGFKRQALANAYLGYCYYQVDSFDFAIEHLTKALHTLDRIGDTQENGKLYAYRAECYHWTENYENVISDYVKALTYGFDSSNVDYYLMGAYYMEDELQMALKWADYLVSVDSMSAQYHGMRGIIHEALEMYENALEDYGMAIECCHKFSGISFLSKRNTKWALGYIYRARCYDKMENVKLAAADYEQAMEYDPDSAAINHEYASFICRTLYKEKYRDAIAVVSDAISLEDSVEYYKTRGRLYYELEEHSRAISDLNHYIKHTTDSSSLAAVEESITLVKEMGGKPEASPLIK